MAQVDVSQLNQRLNAVRDALAATNTAENARIAAEQAATEAATKVETARQAEENTEIAAIAAIDELTTFLAGIGDTIAA